MSLCALYKYSTTPQIVQMFYLFLKMTCIIDIKVVYYTFGVCCLWAIAVNPGGKN